MRDEFKRSVTDVIDGELNALENDINDILNSLKRCDLTSMSSMEEAISKSICDLEQLSSDLY